MIDAAAACECALQATSPLLLFHINTLSPTPPESLWPSIAVLRPMETIMPVMHKSPARLQAFKLRLKELITSAFPRARFNVEAIPNQQQKRIAALPTQQKAFHRTWSRLDDKRRSAACCFEWARLQLFMAVEVLPVFRSSGFDIYHITLVDKRWRVAPEAANRNSFAPVRRKVRAAIGLLRRVGYSPVFIVTYELSGDRNTDGIYAFEPHAHLLVGGVPKPALQLAFAVRLPRSERGRHKPVRTHLIPKSELHNLVSYLTKMRAQDRVQFTGSDGRSYRKSYDMRAANEAHWVRCMATIPITHAVQFGGFVEPFTSRFTHLEMATMLGEF
jgi:hypothetical protein